MDNSILRKKSNRLMLLIKIRNPLYYEKLYIWPNFKIRKYLNLST